MTGLRLALAPVLVATAAAAQQAAPSPLLLVARGDSVFLYVTEMPATADGFLVDRIGAGGETVRITPKPVTRVREPAVAAGIIGADLPMVMRAVRATEEGQAWRRLQSDRFAAGVLMLVSRGVATALGRLVADGGLQPGASYEYRVVWTDARGVEQGGEVRGRLVVADRIPAPPSAVRAHAGDREVVVSWTAAPSSAPGADPVIGFHVYRLDAPGEAPRRLTNLPVLRGDRQEYRDADVRNGVAYRYQVTAVDVLGRESAPSGATLASPLDRTAPAPPTGLVAEAGEGLVRLVWLISPEPDVAGYRVWRSTSLTGSFAPITTRDLPADAPTWTDSGLVAGHPFFYRVIAVDSSGNASAPSNAAWALPADHTPPAPPASVTATLRARRLVVRWTPSPDRDVRGYHVYRGESADALTRLTGLPVPGPELVDSGYGGAGLVPGHAYTVRVTAVDSADNESAPAVAQVRVPDDDPPGPPAGFRVRVGVGRTAELAWSASSALDVRSYVLTREAPGPVVEIARTGADGRAARDTGLVQGRTYVYRLVAVDSVGNSSTVVRDSVFFGDDLPPAAPQAVTARAVTGGVEVTWERVASRDLAGYLVYRADLPTGRFARITPTPVVGQSFTDPSGQVGHFYQVRAVDTARNESGPSPVAGVVK